MSGQEQESKEHDVIGKCCSFCGAPHNEVWFLVARKSLYMLRLYRRVCQIMLDKVQERERKFTVFINDHIEKIAKYGCQAQ